MDEVETKKSVRVRELPKFKVETRDPNFKVETRDPNFEFTVRDVDFSKLAMTDQEYDAISDTLKANMKKMKEKQSNNTQKQKNN